VMAGGVAATGPRDAFAEIRAELSRALAALDEAGANAALDLALARYSIPSALEGVIVPYLQELGAGWEAGEISIAREHFATMILRGRLLGLARNWGAGSGPLAILASPPAEHHDLGLICFGLALRERGWRIMLLGPNTPGRSMIEIARELQPEVLVVAAMDRRLLEPVAADLAVVAAESRLLLAGPGAGRSLARRIGAGVLTGTPVAAADGVATEAGADHTA
jgi:MerR family transcriptional regulator, light-induced transcriptional regulator